MHILVLLLILTTSVATAHAQEIQLATFQETVQILIDQKINNNATASITLQSTSNQEIKIPTSLEQKIRNDKHITSVIVTNEKNCILGVSGESCILVNIARDQSWEGINEIQDNAKEIGGIIIQDINDVLDTDAKFHSVYLHHVDQISKVLDTTDVSSTDRTVSAVYTMPMEDTSSMYQKTSAILVAKPIRDSGGFYATAQDMTQYKDAKMSFSIIPLENTSLYQLKTWINYPLDVTIGKISPLEFLQTDTLDRSSYFSQGFYPLNSLIHVVILSAEHTMIEKVYGNRIPVEIKDGEKIPTDVTKQGWIFDSDSGETIDGKFIFGTQTTVNKRDLEFALHGFTETGNNEQVIIISLIVTVGIVSAMYYLRGYKKS